MDIKEFILINSDKVRRDSSLMAFYIESYYQIFGFKPSCAGCTFNSDWKKFVTAVNNGEKSVTLNTKQLIMETTFKLKKTNNEILAYKVGGRTYRKYDNKLTEEFAIAYLTHGTEEEIEQRKKRFSVLPKLGIEVEPVKEDNQIITDENKPEVKEVKQRKKRTPKQK